MFLIVMRVLVVDGHAGPAKDAASFLSKYMNCAVELIQFYMYTQHSAQYEKLIPGSIRRRGGRAGHRARLATRSYGASSGTIGAISRAMLLGRIEGSQRAAAVCSAYSWDTSHIDSFSTYCIVGLLDDKGINLFEEEDQEMTGTVFLGKTECFIRSDRAVSLFGRIDAIQGAILAPGQKIDNFGEDDDFEFEFTTEKKDTLVLLMSYGFCRSDLFVLRRMRNSLLWDSAYDELQLEIEDKNVEDVSERMIANKRCRAFLRWEMVRELWFRRWCILNYWIKTTGKHQGSVDGPVGKRSRLEFECSDMCEGEEYSEGDISSTDEWDPDNRDPEAEEAEREAARVRVRHERRHDTSLAREKAAKKAKREEKDREVAEWVRGMDDFATQLGLMEKQ